MLHNNTFDVLERKCVYVGIVYFLAKYLNIYSILYSAIYTTLSAPRNLLNDWEFRVMINC